MIKLNPMHIAHICDPQISKFLELFQQLIEGSHSSTLDYLKFNSRDEHHCMPNFQVVGISHRKFDSALARYFEYVVLFFFPLRYIEDKIIQIVCNLVTCPIFVVTAASLYVRSRSMISFIFFRLNRRGRASQLMISV